MSTSVSIGDRVVFTGKYAWQMPEVFGPVDWFEPYPPGTVVKFTNNRFTGREVYVRLDGDDEEFAYWPVTEIERETR